MTLGPSRSSEAYHSTCLTAILLRMRQSMRKKDRMPETTGRELENGALEAVREASVVSTEEMLRELNRLRGVEREFQRYKLETREHLDKLGTRAENADHMKRMLAAAEADAERLSARVRQLEDENRVLRRGARTEAPPRRSARAIVADLARGLADALEMTRGDDR